MAGGRRGPAPKPAHLRQARNKTNDIGLITVNPDLEVPKPSSKWSKQITEEWNAYWQSPLSSVLSTSSDLGSLRRLFDYKHELEWATNAYRKERIAKGSMGQNTLSPWFNAIMKFERMISPLEDRFGMSPMGRLRMGATLGEASRSLSDINKEIDQELLMDEDDDPRDYLDTTSN